LLRALQPVAWPLPSGGAIMFFAPFALLFTWLTGLLSLAVVGGGLYLLWAWYFGVLVGSGYLAAGLLLTLWSVAGRWIVLLFHPAGPDEPHTLEPDAFVLLERPDGTTLYVEKYGPPDAPAIILTHGAGANRTSWYYVIRHLSLRFQLIVWDMPGLGHSPKPRDGDYSLERHARDLEAVIGVAGGRPAVLVGHSMGGMVLLTFCRLFPEDLPRRIQGIVLVDTSHTNPVCTTTATGLMRALQKPVLEPLLHLTVWLAPAVWLMSWLGYFNGSSHLVGMMAGFAGTQTRGQLDLAVRYNPLAWPAVQAHETLAMFSYDATEVLGSITVPALVFTGHLDRLIVPQTGRFMVDRLLNGVLVQLKPAGHMAVFERSQRLVELLSAFAEKVVPHAGLEPGAPRN
jgi:pimeloyl-ACP methyl ester carboxylesterase